MERNLLLEAVDRLRMFNVTEGVGIDQLAQEGAKSEIVEDALDLLEGGVLVAGAGEQEEPHRRGRENVPGSRDDKAGCKMVHLADRLLADDDVGLESGRAHLADEMPPGNVNVSPACGRR